MAVITKIFISRIALEKMLKDAGEKGLSVSVKVGDKVAKTGKNVFMTKMKSQKEIEANTDDVLYASGHSVWSKGECIVNKPDYEGDHKYVAANKEEPHRQSDEATPQEVQKDDDLPF